MTKDEEYRVAKWLMRNGSIKRSNAPAWFPPGFSGSGKLFVIEPGHQNAAGYGESSPDDIFCMSDRCKDAYKEEYMKRRQDWRSEVTLWIAVAALVLSLISISWQTYTWRVERAESTSMTAAENK